MTLNDLVPDVLARVEENLPSATPPGPVFWSLQQEVLPQMVDALFESALITGNVQRLGVPITLAANTTYFPLPKGVFGPLRMKAPYALRKVSLEGLDDMFPDWQNLPAGTQIKAWFPLGVSMFGIYPKMTAETTVIMDFLTSPVNHIRPYTGNENIPFQQEFSDGISQYAAAMLRAKEGGAEAEEASVVYQEYLSMAKALSLFQSRIDSLVFSGAYGSNTETNQRTSV